MTIDIEGGYLTLKGHTRLKHFIHIARQIAVLVRQIADSIIMPTIQPSVNPSRLGSISMPSL